MHGIMIYSLFLTWYLSLSTIFLRHSIPFCSWIALHFVLMLNGHIHQLMEFGLFSPLRHCEYLLAL
jgi:hypothetical protein